MSTNWYKFYRNDLSCALHYQKDGDLYFCYIGFPKEHEYYGAIFKNIGGEGFSHFEISFDNESLDDLWRMGFSIHSIYQNALDRLKDAVDTINKSKTSKSSGGGFSFL